jgi:ubiquitin-like-conjugating enzyme ATG3
MPSLLSNLKSAREYLTPTLKSSAFLTRGVLTPEEFVKAGDELVYKCPTWTWEGGDPSKRKAHLPPDKQFVMTRNVPCTARVSSLENVVAVSSHSETAADDDDGDWLVSQVLSAEEKKKRDEKELEDEFDILDDEGEVVAENKLAALTLGDSNAGDEASNKNNTKSADVAPTATAGDADDEYADMADFEDDDIMEDEAAVTSPTVAADATTTTTTSNHNNDDILKVRTYDLSITYDKYYQTPRIWLMGYADDGSSRPLTGDEMMQDVISDYAHRTVTIENHPHVHGPHASIHPCQHAAVMKTIVRNLTKDHAVEGDESGPSVEMYLFIFLKFVSSMIPTVSYDFTMDVSASTKK